MHIVWDKITSQFIEIIEWLQDDSDTLVWRFPVRGQEIKNGAQLVVREGQVAIFVNEGKLADVFEPGSYTLDTQNLPILSTLKGWKYGFNSPFKAEVYFVRTTEILDQKWGTASPIMMRDPEFGPIRLRARGIYALKIDDAVSFFRQVVGTDGSFDIQEVSGQLKRTLISRFTTVLAKSKVPALDLAAHYDQLGEQLRPTISEDFQALGLQISKFLIESITLPEAVEQALDARTKMGVIGNLQNYAAYQMAEAIPTAAATPNSMAGAGMGLAAGAMMGGQMAGMMSPMMPGMGVQPGVPAQPAPPVAAVAAAPATAESMVERLKKLDALKAAGVLTEEEYATKRTEILSEI